MLPCAAALGDQPPAGPQDRGRGAGTARRGPRPSGRSPWTGSRRRSRRAAAAARPGPRSRSSTRSPNRASRSRAASIIAGEPSSATTRPARQALEQALGDPARPAAGVEHRLVAPQRQPVRARRCPSGSSGPRCGRRSRRPSRAGRGPGRRRSATAGLPDPRPAVAVGRRDRPARPDARAARPRWSRRRPRAATPHTMTARWNESTEADFAALATAGGASAAGGFSGWTIARSAGSAGSTPGTAPASAA